MYGPASGGHPSGLWSKFDICSTFGRMLHFCSFQHFDFIHFSLSHSPAIGCSNELMTMAFDKKNDSAAEAVALDGDFRSLFDIHPSPMWIYDPEDLSFLIVNEAACALYGFSRRDYETMTVLDIRPDHERERMLRAVQQQPNGTALRPREPVSRVPA